MKQWGTYKNNPCVVERGLTEQQATKIDPPNNGKGGGKLDGRLWREFPINALQLRLADSRRTTARYDRARNSPARDDQPGAEPSIRQPPRFATAPPRLATRPRLARLLVNVLAQTVRAEPASFRMPPAQARRGGRPAAHPRAVVVGVPFDTATSWRAGARFGPEAIRSASALLRPFHAVHGVQALAAVTDAGDVAITPGNAARSSEQIAAALAPVCRSTTVPLVLGGDHLVALGELRAQAAAHGALALVLLDAHADTWEDYYGERLFHGTVLRRGAQRGVPERGYRRR